MSEQNKSAPRWHDAREHTLKLLREERDSLAAELPQVENVDERELFDAWLARVDLALATIGAIDDAALARLAEPAQPPEPAREPCPRCGKPLARRGVYHVCPHGVPCTRAGWCGQCEAAQIEREAERSGR